jgi:two-component system, response regulator PdtaR
MVQQAGFAPMRVCVFSPEEKFCETLALDSERAGYQLERKFNEPRKLLEFISDSILDHIVLIDARRQREECLRLIRDLCSGRPRAAVALANEADTRLGARVMEAGAQALLVNPVEPKDICAAFTAAVYQCAKQSRLEKDIDSLRQKLVERKVIEKAKGILMESAKVSEAEAFRLIQKRSQDERKPMAAIAALVISATELVKAARARAE